MNKYVLIPNEVEAMQVKVPFLAVAKWCNGDIYTEGPANTGITINGKIAFKGDWIVYTNKRFIFMTNDVFSLTYKKA